MGTAALGAVSFCGRKVLPRSMALIREVIGTYPALSRMELARTICELVGWRRASGRLKARECWEFLEGLEGRGLVQLPAKRRPSKPVGTRTRVPVTARGDPREGLVGDVGEFGPVLLEAVSTEEQRLLFRELVGRHHYLGHAVPFGAHLRYLAYVPRPERLVVGCVQFASPAWRMAARDRWIGWDDAARRRNLQRVVNNSRFLILPWVRIRNLASTILSLATHRLGTDWGERYGIEPLLAETLVDPKRYTGHCYRASNWVELGETAGRGRMDREHAREGAAPKLVFVYPLIRDAARRLREC